MKPGPRTPSAAARPTGAARTQAMYELMVETLATFFRLRALGRAEGLVGASGAGSWGLLRSLNAGGPQSVPQLARSRPVSRQRVQKLADELARDGLVEFIDNPAHRRSKFLRLTAKGEARFAAMDEKARALCAGFAQRFAAPELASAAQVLRRLRPLLERYGTKDQP